MKRLLYCLFALLLCSVNAYAVEDAYSFDSPEKEILFNELITELRCPQCQNNNIADSNAGISDDMKLKVYELVQQENFQKDQVIEFMTKRYGDFITYRPPVKAGTLILWLLPVLVIGIGVIYLVVRSRQSGAINVEQEEDIDDVVAQELEELEAKPTPLTVWIGAFALLLFVTIGIYAYAGNWGAVVHMKASQEQLPELKAKYINAERMSMKELETLLLGLRSEAFNKPDSVENWVVLGDIYRQYNDNVSAKIAFSHAYKYAPQDNFIRRLYAQFLMQSGDPTEHQKGLLILKDVYKDDDKDVEVLAALAFDAFTRENYKEAADMLEKLLNLLPPDAPRAKMYQTMLERAQSMQTNE